MNVLTNLAAHPIIAHRGASAQAPENTLAAFRMAVEQGADALELDVHLSADGAPVVIHDPTLDRTTDRTGAVALKPLAELRGADAGARFSPDSGPSRPWKGRDVRIPTLDEVIDAFPAFPLLIEIKVAAAQHAVRKVIEEHQAHDHCVVAASDARALAAFHDSSIPLGAARPDIASLYFRTLVRLPRAKPRFRLLAVPVRYRGLLVPSLRFVRAAKDLGCPVHVWTVNDVPTAQRLWRNGVAGIVTNVPGMMRDARDSTSQEVL